jgi:superoxide dismutase, Fe-Mn family
MRNTLTQVFIPKGLPNLEYSYDALEPHIDSRTMELHHTKHHKTYVDELEKVLNRYPELKSYEVTDLLQSLDELRVDEADRRTIRNNGGGHANHSFFWTILGPKKAEHRELILEITDAFRSVPEFKKQFTETALHHFGSGWAWLVRDDKSKLQIYSTPNQDSPLMRGHMPLIGLDVWEHAYYLKYQNRRQEYIDNWWNVLKLI